MLLNHFEISSTPMIMDSMKFAVRAKIKFLMKLDWKKFDFIKTITDVLEMMDQRKPHSVNRLIAN